MTEPIKLLRGILLKELGLRDEQVMLYNQEFPLPPDDRLFLNLAVLGTKSFAVKTEYRPNPVTHELEEYQVLNRQEMISILCFSAGSLARERNWEIVPALSGTLAQQVMEENSFLIGKLPTSMNDVSEQDGARRLNRYSLTFNVLVAYSKVKSVDYFDEVSGPLLTTNP